MTDFNSSQGAFEGHDQNEQTDAYADAWANILSEVPFSGDTIGVPTAELKPEESVSDNQISNTEESEFYNSEGIEVNAEGGESIYDYVDRLAEMGALGVRARGRFNDKEIDNYGTSDRDELLHMLAGRDGKSVFQSPGYLKARRVWSQNTTHANNFEDYEEKDANYDRLLKTEEEVEADRVRLEAEKTALAEEMARTEELRRTDRIETVSLPEDVSQLLFELDAGSGERIFEEDGIADLTGVLVGLKRCGALIGKNKDSERIASTIRELGLEQRTWGETDGQIVFIFGREVSDVERTRELFGESVVDGQEGTQTRELGTMLGYPKSATDFFIERNRAKNKGELLEGGFGSFYIHSPDKFEEECFQYEVPLLAHLKRYCPNTAKAIGALMEDNRNEYYSYRLAKINDPNM